MKDKPVKKNISGKSESLAEETHERQIKKLFINISQWDNTELTISQWDDTKLTIQSMGRH